MSIIRLWVKFFFITPLGFFVIEKYSNPKL